MNDPVGGGIDSPTVRAAIAAAQQGDMEALHFLYARYADDVLRHVQRLIGDRHEAEDVTQNVFLKLMTAIEKYEPREVPFAAWILRVARNMALDHLRVRRAVPSEDLVIEADDRSRVARERGRDLSEALAQLPEDQREVLILRHIVGLSPVEIASALGKTESSIHGLHHRGRLSVKSALAQMGAAPVVAQTELSPS